MNSTPKRYAGLEIVVQYPRQKTEPVHSQRNDRMDKIARLARREERKTRTTAKRPRMLVAICIGQMAVLYDCRRSRKLSSVSISKPETVVVTGVSADV